MPSPSHRESPFDEGQAASFLTRAWAGETICGLLREPGMPNRRTYARWQACNPAFSEAVRALLRRRDREIGRRGRARFRAFDLELADRILLGVNSGRRLEAVLAADPALPCRPTLRRWRRENPEFDARLKMIFAVWRERRRATVSEIVVLDVAEHIADGGSFASLTRAGGPSRGTLRRWYRADPGFARAVDAACDVRDESLEFELWLAAERVPPGPVREMNRAVAPITREMARLRHRPGTAHRKTQAPVDPRTDSGPRQTQG